MECKISKKSTCFGDLVKHIKKLADTEVPILLHGETGTGKNWFATFIHSHSLRRNNTFLRLDCSELNSNLLESELFGHEKGAFTGAVDKKVGYLELVNGGTLFLDEITNLDLRLQVKLLRVLDEKKFRRVGGRKDIPTDFRVISATNGDINRLLESGVFREDLYYRLKGAVVDLPPLRERQEDIVFFINNFLKEFNRQYKKDVIISSESMNCLQRYHWPGNIRELRMVIETLISTLETSRIELRHIPLEIQRHELLQVAENGEWTAEDLLNAYAMRVLISTGGNKSQAAKILGWSVNTFKKRLNQ